MSSAESFIARSQRRGRRITYVMVVVAVGLVAAAAISLVAGARRSSSVVNRFFAAEPRYDVRVFSQSLAFQPDAVRALPGVVRADPTSYMSFIVRDRDPATAGLNSVPADFSQPNPTVQVLRGRRPGADPFEVVVNEAVVTQLGLDVGDRVPVTTFAPDQFDEIERGIYTPRGPSYDFKIAAVIRAPDDIAVDEPRSPRPGVTSSANVMIVSLDFWTAHRSEFIDFGTEFDVRLADGAAGVGDFLGAAKRLAGDAGVGSQPWGESDRKSAFAAPVDLETGALLSVGIGAAIGALGLIVLLLRLDQRGLERESEVLRSIGVTSNGLARVAVRRALPATLTAALVAVVGSVAMSARFPIGLGRQLELSPGVSANIAVVGVGVALVVALPLTVAALFAGMSHSARDAEPVRHTPRLLSNSRLPLHSLLGTRMALGRNGKRQRASSVVGLSSAVVTIAVVVAVSMWTIGTQRLYDEPSSRGWLWDIAIGNVNFSIDPATAEAVQHSPLVAKATAVSYGQATLNGLSTEVLAFDLAGTAPPDIVQGRLPASPTEAALGAGLMRSLHVRLGGTVTLSLDGSEFIDDSSQTTPVQLTVVGESVSPVFGESDVADVGLVPLDAIAMAGGDASPRIMFTDVVGPDRAASVAQLIADYSEEVHSDVIPARIVNLRRVRVVPIAGAVLAAVMAIVALVATTFAARRWNRRTFVVLIALGLDRAGRMRVLGWQGVVAAGCVLLLGLPIGLLANAAWWRAVSEGLGVRVLTPVSATLLIGTIAIVVIAGLAAAFAAARASHRTSVAGALRAE